MKNLKYKFVDLVDIPAFEQILTTLYDVAGIPSAIIDMEGNILTGAGWQRFCLDFHRKNPESEKLCIESDTHISKEIADGKPYVVYECPHGLVDSSCPIIIDGHHIANVFTGQMLHTPLDTETLTRFKNQAQLYGFNETDYLNALSEVPVFPLEKHRSILELLSQLATQIAQTGLAKLISLEQKEIFQENEEKLAVTFESIGDGLVTTDIDGNVVLINKVAEKLTGWSKKEAIGQPLTIVFNIISELTRKPCENPVNKVLSTNQTVELENHTLLIAKDGTEKCIADSAAPITNNSGDIIGVVLVFRDETEKRETRAKIKELHKQIEFILGATNTGLDIIDSNFNIRYIDPEWASKYGPIDNRKCFKFFADLDEPCEGCGILKSIESKEIVVAEEVLPKENNRPIEVTTIPFKSSDGEWLFAEVNVDISRRKKDQKDKLKLESQLRQSHKMEAIGTMAGGIAHDFNNILSAIIGYADLAKLNIPDSNPAKQQIEQVLHAGDRAKNLVKHILTFSRMSLPEQSHGQFPLKTIVKEVLNFQRSIIPTTTSIVSEIDENCGDIKGDPTQIHQIIMNFCANASYAMEEKGGVLTVAICNTELSDLDMVSAPDLNPGTYAKLSVSDTGHGMAPELIGKIFDPYFTTKKIGEGSGMGLAVVHGIVQTHGGFIKVDSVLGKGSTFNVFLPIVKETTISSETDKTKAMPTGTENVLFVDDEEALANLGKSLLEKLGYSVTSLADSTEALNLFKNDPTMFDVVITDQTMPNISGSELSKQLLQVRPDIPIILVTGYSGKIDELKAQKIGIREYAMKPFNKITIANLIRKVLDDDKTKG